MHRGNEYLQSLYNDLLLQHLVALCKNYSQMVYLFYSHRIYRQGPLQFLAVIGIYGLDQGH